MTKEEIQATQAHENRESIVRVRYQIEYGFVELARLLKECRDGEFYKALGYDTFEVYLADPDLSFKRSTAYNLIRLYEKFVLEMGKDPKLLAEVGSSKLSVIAPVVDSDPDGWLGKAQAMGKLDLISEVREKQGRPPYVPDVQPVERGWKDFEGFKMSCGCLVCGGPDVEKSHWPRTRGAGGGEDDWVPMCRKCHTEFHQTGVDSFWEKYKYRIGTWIHAALERAYSISKQGEKK